MDHGSSLGVSPVAIDRNWQRRVQNEIESSKKWETEYGFLSGGAEWKDSVDDFLSTNRNVHSTMALNLRETVRKRRETLSHDSVDGFMHHYMVKSAGPYMRALPKQEFQRPTLSSHAVGWGKNLERFGALKLHLR